MIIGHMHSKISAFRGAIWQLEFRNVQANIPILKL